MAAWGEVRATRDIALLCRARDLEVLKSALRRSQFKFEHCVGADVIRVETGSPAVPYEIDLLAGIRGAPPNIFDRVRCIQIDDFELPVASPEDTIILKLLGGSVRDLADARTILRVQKTRLDIALLKQLCPESLREGLAVLLRPEARI